MRPMRKRFVKELNAALSLEADFGTKMKTELTNNLKEALEHQAE